MDIEKYNPKVNPKYLGYIYRFLKKELRLMESIGTPPRIVKFEDGCGWYIGWFIDDGIGDFIGSRISFVEEKVQVFCFIKSPPEKIIDEVQWGIYDRVGGCAISRYLHKWIKINRNYRKCIHCGEMQKRRIVTVKTIERKEIYEPAI